ncbi:hypothetical protein ROLI_036570 [Roseobacter fucihabitans]|uniref:Uncharacterized protein n=1 Tax=Roseobacter fucihabitans TaxID=1537242 RepID=A0ABZ2C0Z7_9RHOB|nr:hypothetical protein [Roseobacter litoralis]
MAQTDPLGCSGGNARRSQWPGSGSHTDCTFGHLRPILGLISLSDVEIIAADQVKLDPDAAMAKTAAGIALLAA